ncbi:ATP-dependent DNA helicase PIF1 [Mycena sanguinolenta]|uniref:ATP-dependent DNA helicase PIF1 n=1 Tax=Mycena sanguinolenta TaxID=230812 RepID=A0A8H6X7X8_9AGAR|nr:ATP-dependent DNA helicase PIF1 [Mycena sanguinolenta]
MSSELERPTTPPSAPALSQEILWEATPPKELWDEGPTLQGIEDAAVAREVLPPAFQKTQIGNPTDNEKGPVQATSDAPATLEQKSGSSAAGRAQRLRDIINSLGNTPTPPTGEGQPITSKKRSLAHSTPSSAPPRKKPESIEFTHEQSLILDHAVTGNSLFYTGNAGTGKSALLHELISRMKRTRPKLGAVAVTATTGLAACNIGGTTLHSFTGIGVGTETAEEAAERIRKIGAVRMRWYVVKVLIVDEVSMLDAQLFGQVGSSRLLDEEELAAIRWYPSTSHSFFLIVTGDFFQLPPVAKNGTARFAFEAEVWPMIIKKTFTLTTVFRQRDPEFVKMLNEVRLGLPSEDTTQKFRSLSRRIEDDNDVIPTELFPQRGEVDLANAARLNMLHTAFHCFKASDSGSAEKTYRTKLLDSFMAVPELKLGVGAQVMLIKNVDETLVNGSVGVVVSFCSQAEYDEEKGNGDRGSDVLASCGVKYPVVRFKLPNGRERKRLVTPEVFKIEMKKNEIQASRKQVPLILAWAISIHKSQGQTLDRMKVDLARVFEKGQVYVALSRAKSLEGLQVLNFHPTKVEAHAKVLEFNKTLMCANESATLD